MLTFTLLLALAITSTNGMVRRMGFEKWQRLHYAIYIAAICAVLHFWWLVKLDITWPFIYSFMLAALLGVRLWWLLRAKRAHGT